MRISKRPVVHALLMTTAVAWSIGVRLPDSDDADQPVSISTPDTGDEARRGTVVAAVLPARRDGARGERAPASGAAGQ